MNTKLSAIISQYRAILDADGIISKEELIEILKLDEEILDKYKTEQKLNLIADEILKIGERVSGTKKAMEQRMELYKKGLTDSEIASIQGVTVTTITNWRTNRELPNNGKSRLLPKEEHERRMKAYMQGLTDREAAELLGLTSPQTFANWRKKRNLPLNKGSKGRKKNV